MPNGDPPSPPSTTAGETRAQTTPVEAATTETSKPPSEPARQPECASSFEFHALGLVPDNYLQRWTVLGPDSSYAYWTHEWSGNDTRVDSFRWTASKGVQILAVQAEPWAEEEDLFFSLVSSDGGTVLGVRYLGEPDSDGFRWTPEAGMSSLDFAPVAMTPDAKVAVGFSEGIPVRWLDGVGAIEIDPAWSALGTKLSLLTLSRSGDVVLSADFFSGRTFRWTTTTGSADLGLLDGAASRTLARYMSENGDVIAGVADFSLAAPARAVRWTEATGLQALGDVPGAPAGAGTQVFGMSKDGSAIIGQVALDSSFAHAFRWTEATGMQDLTPGDRKAQVSYLSPDGQVVIGYYFSDLGSAVSGFRWTAATGAVDVSYTTPLGIGADGDLLVGNNLQGPFIHTFGKLAGKTPDLVRLAGPGLLPRDWSEPHLEGVSRDARLLVGEGINPSGQREPWLMRLIDVCPTP